MKNAERFFGIVWWENIGKKLSLAGGMVLIILFFARFSVMEAVVLLGWRKPWIFWATSFLMIILFDRCLIAKERGSKVAHAAALGFIIAFLGGLALASDFFFNIIAEAMAGGLFSIFIVFVIPEAAKEAALSGVRKPAVWLSYLLFFLVLFISVITFAPV